jgi:hypothetical protein
MMLLAPDSQQREHGSQVGDWPWLHTGVEAQAAQQQGRAVIPQRQLLQTRGQAEAMGQRDGEHSGKQVGRGHLEILLKAPVVVETLVYDTGRDDGVHHMVVPGNFATGRKDPRDAVADGEDRHDGRR